MSVLAALFPLLAAPLAADDPTPDDARFLLVQTREEDGFAPVALVAANAEHVLVVPLLGRSERVARAVRGPRGLALRISAASPGAPGALDRVRVHAVRHRTEERVLLADREPLLVGPPTLPAGLPPELARHDGFGAAAPASGSFENGSFENSDLELVAIPLEPADPREAPGGAARALVGADAIDAAGVALDQLVLASVRALDDAELVPLELRRATIATTSGWTRTSRHGHGTAWHVPVASAGRETLSDLARTGEADGDGLDWPAGDALDLWFGSPPDAPAGETWSLVVTLLGTAGIAPAEPPAEAAAARALFEDVALAAGARRVHLEGPDEQLDIRPTMGPGAAWGDADGDGWNDLYLVQGSGRDGARPGNALLWNRGDGTFAESESGAGCEDRGAGMGALFFDAEGDGDLDLYVANYGADALYANRGERRFADVSAAAGIGGDRWSAGICAADFDRDGDLDLYVTSYLDYDPAKMPSEDELGRYRREDPIEMLPFAFPGQANAYLRNESGAGEPRFVDATETLGLADAAGRGMQPVAWDFDRDGASDLYVANDVSYNVLWRNAGDGTFEDVSFATGMDDPRGGMGVAVGDVDADGDEDLLLTNWELEPNALYLNNLLAHDSARHRVPSFRDAIVASGLGPYGVGATGWGAELLDADLDGDLDLFVANGYTSPDYASTGICVGQPNHYFENDGEGRFAAAFERAGPALAAALPSRAAVACDYDRDGDLDLVVTANNSATQLLRNRAVEDGAQGRWLGVRLAARAPNPFAIGAEVTLEADGRAHRATLRAGTSYLGGNPPELHFGLGAARRVDALVVRWPSGAESRHDVDALDRWITVSEPR